MEFSVTSNSNNMPILVDFDAPDDISVILEHQQEKEHELIIPRSWLWLWWWGQRQSSHWLVLRIFQVACSSRRRTVNSRSFVLCHRSTLFPTQDQSLVELMKQISVVKWRGISYSTVLLMLMARSHTRRSLNNTSFICCHLPKDYGAYATIVSRKT